MSATDLPALLATELRLHRRHGVLVGSAVMGVLWTLVLLALPAAWRGGVLPWVLFFEVTAIGFFFVPALSVVERGNGVTAALSLTRLPFATALAVRLAALLATAIVVAVALVAVSGAGWSATVLTGVVLTTLLFSLVAVVMVGRAETLTVFMARAPVVAGPLLAPALLHATGLVESPLLHLSPATGALRMLHGEAAPLVVGWIVVSLLGLWVLAVRIGFDVRPTARRAPAWARRTGAIEVSRPGRWTAVCSYARVDRRTLLSDQLLILLLAGLPLIALALRWLSGPGVGWVDLRFGMDVSAYVPAVGAFVLVIHVPVIVGSLAGLLFLEDRDEGLLATLATTPAGLTTLVTYRLAATVGLTAIAVAVAAWISGTTHPAGGFGLVAAAAAGGAASAVPAVLLATFAHDRVQGMALMKAITVPLYAPVAWWFVDGPLGWLFAPIPTALAARTLWAPDVAQALAFAAACTLVSAGVVGLVAPRLLRAPAIR